MTMRRKHTRAKLRRRPRMLALGAALTLAVAALACESRPPHGAAGSAETHPVVLVGIDGLEWSVVLRLVERNRVPTLASLMRRGSVGALTATQPTLSPIIWTSIATGVGSRVHGILGFVHGAQKTKGPGGRAAQLYTSNDRRVKAFWNIATDAGRRVHTIGWWMTYPVERINGVMVAQVNTITPQMRRDGRGIWKGELVEGVTRQVHPPEREAGLLEMIARTDAEISPLTKRIFGTFPENAPPVPAALLEQSLWAFRADALYQRVALDVLANDGAFDLFAVYFGGADVVGHRFWRHAHPRSYRYPPDDAEIEAFGHVLDAYYAYLDELLGSLLAAAPPDANVIVVSDHGMSAIRRGARFATPALSGGHLSAPAAFLVAAGPDVRSDGIAARRFARKDIPTVGSVLDVTPTILALLGIPVGRDMEGAVMTGWLAEDSPARELLPAVATHTEPGWFEGREKPIVTSTGSDERLEQLRSLGYLDR